MVPDVPLPMPRACVLLAALLPFIACSGVALALRASGDRRTSTLIGPGLGLAAWLLCVHLTARAAGSFFVPFALSTIAVAVPGAWFVWRTLRRGERWWQPWSRAMLATALGSTLLLLPAVGLYFFDETWISGHMATVAQIQNGWYPPRYSGHPAFEFRYHYGFDTLAAMVGTMFRLNGATAIDVTTLGLFFYTTLLLGGVARRVLGSGSGAVPAFVAAFAGGVPFFCAGPDEVLSAQLAGNTCHIDDLAVNPSLPAYYFQHPFVLGIPLGLVLLVLVLEAPAKARLLRYAAFALLLATLSVSHIVIFATFGATAVFVECVSARHDWRRVVGTLAAGVAALGIARASGGFFLPALEAQSLSFHLGVTDTTRGSLEWMARSFGVHLVLGFIGLALLRRGKLFLLLLAVGSLAVLSTVRYSQSWDIVKFATVALLVLGLGTGALAAHLWQLAKRLEARERLGLSALSIALALGATAAGVAFHAIFWLRLPSAYHDTKPFVLAGNDVEVLRYLRKHVRPDEIVYRVKESSRAYNQWGGIATPWPGFPANEFGFEKQDAARRKLLLTKPWQPEPWLAQRIRWFVLDTTDVDVQRRVERWQSEGRARTVRTHGTLTLIRVH